MMVRLYYIRWLNIDDMIYNSLDIEVLEVIKKLLNYI